MAQDNHECVMTFVYILVSIELVHSKLKYLTSFDSKSFLIPASLGSSQLAIGSFDGDKIINC